MNALSEENLAYVHNWKYYESTWEDAGCQEKHSFVCEVPYQYELTMQTTFVYNDQPHTWANAQAACLAKGGNLSKLGLLSEHTAANLVMSNATQPCSWIFGPYSGELLLCPPFFFCQYSSDALWQEQLPRAIVLT